MSADDPRMSDHRMSDLRISDLEREQAAAELAEHYAEGRLTTEEHSERLDLIWAARTRRELGPIFADLPHGGTGTGQPPGASERSPRRRPRGVPLPFLVLLGVLVAVTAVTHMPLILVGLAVWFLFFRHGCRPHSNRW